MPDNPYEANDSSPNSISKSSVFTWVFRIGITLVIGIVLLGLFLPAVRRAQPAAHRMSCSSNLRQLGIALSEYELAYHELPPAYTVDESGKPLHSWRTLILPYLEQQDLYSKIDLTKSWDDPANDAARQTNVRCFRCPAAKMPQGMTTYQAVIAPSSCLQPGKGRLLEEISDGLANTLLLVESDVSDAVHWMSPLDLTLGKLLSSSAKSNTAHLGGRNVCFGDSSLKFFVHEVSIEMIRAMVTIDGGEDLNSMLND